jgi:hypothetical protein
MARRAEELLPLELWKAIFAHFLAQNPLTEEMRHWAIMKVCRN